MLKDCYSQPWIKHYYLNRVLCQKELYPLVWYLRYTQRYHPCHLHYPGWCVRRNLWKHVSHLLFSSPVSWHHCHTHLYCPWWDHRVYLLTCCISWSWCNLNQQLFLHNSRSWTPMLSHSHHQGTHPHLTKWHGDILVVVNILFLILAQVSLTYIYIFKWYWSVYIWNNEWVFFI